MAVGQILAEIALWIFQEMRIIVVPLLVDLVGLHLGRRRIQLTSELPVQLLVPLKPAIKCLQGQSTHVLKQEVQVMVISLLGDITGLLLWRRLIRLVFVLPMQLLVPLKPAIKCLQGQHTHTLKQEVQVFIISLFEDVMGGCSRAD